MSFLNLTGKAYVVVGIANNRSVANHVGRQMVVEGATVNCSVRSPQRADSVASRLPDC